ncbi:Putative aldehyde dehydrogenase-like protein [Sparassis crispa]|uniref:Aldehyde dehydrogenase-like protein n=1 Tax=Sparassis crispa TaxID=139825 RepID=A0A401G5I5_9APHY|nr:Putative aldehyde dehydrogenase-like protein [Sparassis crispa]GBE77417.1 Putative aldehyde dehydrogenase-like protein [Sparassis crispa]
MGYDHDDEGGMDVLYLVTITFALGIYLVVWRFQTIHNRAVPFFVRSPDQIGPNFQGLSVVRPDLEAHLRHEELMPPYAVPGRRYITSFDPSTGYHIGTFVADSSVEIGEKIRRAAEAQRTWRNTAFRDRRRVVRSLKKWLVDNQEVCARVACRDTGKTLLDAALGEIMTTCAKMEWLINHGEKVLRPETRRSSLMMSYKTSQVHWEPLGVVAALVSWNYPLHNAWSPILAALFSGNAIVLKCSEHVIWSSEFFVLVIKECLRACGHNSDLVQLVCCYPEDAEAVTKSPEIKHITFIGSEEVGRKVVAAAAENLTPVTLELGGKDPTIILPNTDLSRYGSIWMRGVFQNAGQNCIGIERILVHSSQYEEVYAMFLERTKELRQGSALSNPNDGFVPAVDVGSMINADRLVDLERVVAAARDGGARVEVGGTAFDHPYMKDGSYFSPTVVGDVDPQSEIAQREMFAPIGLIMKYETVDEAVELANGTRYGLGAAVFGPNREECIKAAKRLRCGMVSINDFAVFYMNQDLPFGGIGHSGYGRFAGPEGLRSLCNAKAIVWDRFGWLVQTSIPKPLDYPVRSNVQSWEFVSGLIGFLYAEGWRTRIRSLVQLFKVSG